VGLTLHHRAPDWFRGAKFGIFLHWGVFSVPAFGNKWYSRNMYVPGDKAFQHHIATYGPQSKFGYKDSSTGSARRNSPPSHGSTSSRRPARVTSSPSASTMTAFPCTPRPSIRGTLPPWVRTATSSVSSPRPRAPGGLRFGISSHTAEHWWWYGAGRTFDSDVRSMSSIGNNSLPPTDELYGPAASMEMPTAVHPQDLTKEPDPSHLERWVPPNESFLEEWLAKSTEIVDRYHPDLMYIDWWNGQAAFMPVLQQFADARRDRRHR
jgi:alpha-L-fucosidase